MQHVCLMTHTIFARDGGPVKIITKVFKSKALAIASVKQELIHKADVRPNPNDANDNVEFFDVDDPSKFCIEFCNSPLSSIKKQEP